MGSCRRRVRVLATTAVLLLAASVVNAQDPAPAALPNALYFELLGSGGLYSINYERAVTPLVRVRVGAASWTAQSFWGGAETRIRTFPLMLHVVPGSGAHHVEAAIGVLPGSRGGDRQAGASGSFVSLIGSIGYRYEPPARRFVFRAGLTPFYGFGAAGVAYPEDGFLPSLGLSFGARF